jgi:hypothetical protein
VSRADLLALTPDALARLANVGLVKRAQKELDSGAAPTLVEEPDGTVVATARDRATTRLQPGVALRQTSCTCGAAQVCRHRIAAVLAYQANAPNAGSSDAKPDGEWDPGTLTDEALLRCCGPQAVAQAEAVLARGLVVTLRPGGTTAPSAILPTATVQFLVPHDVAYAKCDCAKEQACEHVVLAVRAFRAGPKAGGMFTLGGESAAPAAASKGPTPTHTAVVDALVHLVQHGITAPGSQARLTRARAAAQRDGWWWVVDTLESVERLVEAYQRQSALFRLSSLTREVGELAARVRASLAHDAPLPARFVLGSDTRGETAMEQVRLVSLGARLDADDDRRMVRIYLADPDTATVLVLDKTWVGERRNGPELGALFASSRMSIADLARGELVTRAARRRANGALDLGAARGMKSSLLPTSGSWDQLPEPLLVRDLKAHGERLRALPPRCLCPRGLGAGIAVVKLGAAREVEVTGDGQAVTARVEDTTGIPLRVHTHHRQVSPGAVDTTAEALRAGATHVAGELRRTNGTWSMEPLALLTHQLVVVDLQPPAGRSAERGGDEDEGESPTANASPSAADTLVAAIEEYVGRTLLKGANATHSAGARLAKEADALSANELGRLCTRAAAGASSALIDLAVLVQLEQT